MLNNNSKRKAMTATLRPQPFPKQVTDIHQQLLTVLIRYSLGPLLTGSRSTGVFYLPQLSARIGVFFFSTFIYFWDRVRQSMNGGGAEREGDTESETGSRL